jgi:hypothetical protein
MTILVKITKVKNEKLEDLGMYDAKTDPFPNVGDSIYFNGPGQLWVIERHWTVYTSNKENVVELFVVDHAPTSNPKEIKGDKV